MRLPRRFGTIALSCSLLVLAACVSTQNVQQVPVLEAPRERPRILLMPPDIRYYRLTAGGVAEPHAEWTEAARANFSTAVQAFASERGTELEVLDDDDMRPVEIRYSKLHEAVGTMVLLHHFGPAKLPAKGREFDWTLGPGIREIAEDHDADYALFAFYRDQQASGGRVAVMAVAAALGGYVYGGAGGEHGFASLVDLRSGDVVWFNVVAAGSGELRDADGARAAVDKLFSNLPAGRTQ